ncbi:MAG: hypothetical protein IJT56_10525 [Clostridia bacterium]|nr:hypothetical protein [Clostridia bacterium]
MKIEKTAASLLAALMLASSLAACGETAETQSSAHGTTPEDSTAAGEAADTTTEDPGPALELPEADYEGYTVKILTLPMYNEHFKLNTEQNGDSLDDAGYLRNLALGELLNVSVEIIEADQPANILKKSVMAGDHAYDYVFPHASDGVAPMVINKLLYDWNTMNHVDFTKPWWNQMMTTSLGIGGHLFYASGDIVMAWQGMQATLFNKTKSETYLPGTDLYQVTFDGKWTVDYLASAIKGVSYDLDGDGAMKGGDFYGLQDNGGMSFQYGADIRVTNPDENGWPVLALNTERMAQMVTKYSNLMWSGEVWLDTYSNASYPTSTYRDMIVEERCFMSTLDIGGLYSNLREIEYEFGVLPVPKFDEIQENYRVFCGAGLIGVPIDSPDIDRSAVIMEAMAYYSYQYIRPAFFDIVLENKAVRDENSYKVIRMMHENKVFDFGFNFDTTGLGYNMLKNVVVDKKSTDFASYYAKNESKIQKAFDKVINAVQEYENG